MNKKQKDYTTLLEIGGEGGSITINKKFVGGKYRYWFAIDEAAMADLLDDLEGIDYQSNSSIVDSFEEAFAMAKKKYPIFNLYLLFIDDEVVPLVVKEFSGDNWERSKRERVGRNWKRLLGVE